MPHLSSEGLRELLTKARKEELSPEEKELLKSVIPMQLGEENAKKMMILVNEIRDGKRPPLSEEERIEMNKRNMEETLVNFLAKLTTATDEELQSALEMCERIRASRYGQ